MYKNSILGALNHNCSYALSVSRFIPLGPGGPETPGFPGGPSSPLDPGRPGEPKKIQITVTTSKLYTRTVLTSDSLTLKLHNPLATITVNMFVIVRKFLSETQISLYPSPLYPLMGKLNLYQV